MDGGIVTSGFEIGSVICGFSPSPEETKYVEAIVVDPLAARLGLVKAIDVTSASCAFIDALGETSLLGPPEKHCFSGINARPSAVFGDSC